MGTFYTSHKLNDLDTYIRKDVFLTFRSNDSKSCDMFYCLRGAVDFLLDRRDCRLPLLMGW